mmetsp:Transcript_99957/g.291542  ORF Transcript_99957/g.291542 Transcript_99957/m.291542 type:complete len:530 (+) Transcript_99957:58-1647(+)
MPLASIAYPAWLLLCASHLAKAALPLNAGETEGECEGQTCATPEGATVVDDAGLLQLKNPEASEDVVFAEAEVADVEAASPALVQALSVVGVTGNTKPAYDAMPQSMRDAMDTLGSSAAREHGAPQPIPECKFDTMSDCSMKGLSQRQFTGIVPNPSKWGTHCINASSKYMFQVYPGRSDKLLLYFQDGGACWDPLSASMPYDGTKGVCKQEIVVQGEDGIFDMDDKENPYKDFTVLHVNYCSGDAHAGNSVHDWGRQAGYNNTLAALAWAKQNMDNKLDHLSISGASAGALGAQVWARDLLTDFKAGKRSYTSASVVVDSYLGLFPPDTQPYVLAQVFKACGTRLGRGWSKKCGGSLTVQDAVEETMKMFENVPFLFINSKGDSTQSMFYSAISFTLKKQIVVLNDATIYGIATGLFERYDKRPNFAVFQVDGTHHVFLPRARCTGKNHTDCDGDVYDVKTTGPLAVLDGRRSGTSLIEWLQSAMSKGKNSVTENVCHGTDASYAKMKPFPMDACDRSLAGKVLELAR